MMYRRYTVKQLSELSKLMKEKDMDFKDFEKARIALENVKVPIQYNLGGKEAMEKEYERLDKKADKDSSTDTKYREGCSDSSTAMEIL